ncbi:hypothetical protein M426DRAFT_27859 [Hypoxylon sp. CI-4A]|nr:hypothetical protein M426DRAFT_27859 [Hypoxylon sp. CI-4A]
MADEITPKETLIWDDVNFVSHVTGDHERLISACEKLGDLLGSSFETCEQVRSLVLTSDKPKPLPDLEVTVGFSPTDVSCYLSRKPGGLKFLSLVCALVTAFDEVECAQLIAKLMQIHLDRGFTSEQLSPLISAIYSRCQRSGFADIIVRYEILISRRLRRHKHDAASLSRLGKVPSARAMIWLVELLLLQNKASEGRDLSQIAIRTGRCAPWMAAFLYWCLRKESLVSLEQAHSSQTETLIESNTNAGIKLALSPDEHVPDNIKIRAIYSETDFEDREYGPGSAEHYGGLIRIDSYFNLMLNAFKLNRGQAELAAMEVIPYALSEARKGLTMCSGGCVSCDRWGGPCEITTDIAGTKARLRHQKGSMSAVDKVFSDRFEPFPERKDINTVLQLIDGYEREHMKDLRSKQMGLRIHEHKQAATFLEAKKYESDLAEWQSGRFKSQFTPMTSPGATTIFHEQIAHIVATILALSLFHNPENLLVRPDPFIWKNPEFAPSTIISAIHRVFRKQKACCDVAEWHRVGRKLVGEQHSMDKELSQVERRLREHTLISCYGGQAVWPAIALDKKVPTEGESYLRLHWHKGNLYSDRTRERHDRVVIPEMRHLPGHIPQGNFQVPARLSPSEMVAGEPKTKFFQVKKNPLINSKTLLSQMQWRRDANPGNTGTATTTTTTKITSIDPTGILKTLASAERIHDCPHDPDTPLTIPIPNPTADTPPSVYLSEPEDVRPWLLDWARRAETNTSEVKRLSLGEVLEHARSDTEKFGRPGVVAVVPTAGDEGLRFLALAKPAGAHVAVRERACVACCLEFCRAFGFGILVL